MDQPKAFKNVIFVALVILLQYIAATESTEPSKSENKPATSPRTEAAKLRQLLSEKGYNGPEWSTVADAFESQEVELRQLRQAVADLKASSATSNDSVRFSSPRQKSQRRRSTSVHGTKARPALRVPKTPAPPTTPSQPTPLYMTKTVVRASTPSRPKTRPKSHRAIGVPWNEPETPRPDGSLPHIHFHIDKVNEGQSTNQNQQPEARRPHSSHVVSAMFRRVGAVSRRNRNSAHPKIAKKTPKIPEETSAEKKKANSHGFTSSPADYRPFRTMPPTNVHDSVIMFAENTKNNLHCVLKQSNKSTNNEILILKHLNRGEVKSPFIEQIYHCFRTEKTMYQVHEFVEGTELYELIANSPGNILEDAKILEYIAQIASAVQFVHSRNVIYDDLKPENLMLSKNERIVLIDFDSSFYYDNYKGPVMGHGFGSDGYESPEKVFANDCAKSGLSYVQYDLREVTIGYDWRSDYFSLGVIFYIMYCGHFPFDFEKFKEKVKEFKYELTLFEPDFMCQRLKDDRDAYDFALRLLHFDPAKRLGSHGFAEIEQHPYFRRGGADFWPKILQQALSRMQQERQEYINKKAILAAERSKDQSRRRKESQRRAFSKVIPRSLRKGDKSGKDEKNGRRTSTKKSS